jgi:hypothetical protein
MLINKIIFVFAALTVLSLSLNAQSQSSTPEERAQKWDDWMKKELAITPDQEANTHAINLKYAQMNEQLKSSTETRRSKFQEIKLNESYKEKELKQVLTKDQFRLYQEKKKDMQKKMMQSMRK